MATIQPKSRPVKNSNLKVAIFVALLLFTCFSYYFYQIFQTANVDTKGREMYVRIPTGATYEQAMDSIESKGVIIDRLSFRFMGRLMDYDELVKPGFYEIPDDASNYYFIRKLRAGEQVPVKVTFHNIRLKKDLANKLAEYIEADGEEIYALLNDQEYVNSLGFDTTTIMSMFIPNTYEVYWTSTPKELLSRLNKEYQKFWTPERDAKAKALGLSRAEVSTLASIVEAETQQNPEKARIAGVYLNRLKKNHPLEADPTLVFAAQDFTIKRVLNKHKETDSPYNTYRYAGLPPGPINVPSIASLNAVLNYEKHDYFYFCAREDFSGYHNFAVTLNEHLRNARIYHQALNKARIL